MLPLDGFRILAVEQYGAGPFGTMLLGDLGAEIIKIENPADGGDMARAIGPHFLDSGDSEFFQSFNRNKKSLTLDLKAAEGREALRDLVRSADGLLDNLRGDLPDKLGLTYASLCDVNPRIVCAHLTAYGREGERAAWPGYDYLMQAESGYLNLTGEPDGPPSRCGISIIDMMTGVMAGFALLSGMLGARASGQGCDLDTSLFDTSLHNLSYLATWYLNEGVNQTREARSSHPSLTPSQLYRTKDGWIFIMCNKEKFWPMLARAIGHPEWGDDPAFRSFADRLKQREKLTEMLDAALQARTTAAWLAHFAGQIPAAPVYDIRQALDNPFVRENGNIGRFHPKTGESFEMLLGPIRVPGEAPRAEPAPALGEDTDALLEELGYDKARIARLREKGVIG